MIALTNRKWKDALLIRICFSYFGFTVLRSKGIDFKQARYSVRHFKPLLSCELWKKCKKIMIITIKTKASYQAPLYINNVKNIHLLPIQSNHESWPAALPAAYVNHYILKRQGPETRQRGPVRTFLQTLWFTHSPLCTKPSFNAAFHACLSVILDKNANTLTNTYQERTRRTLLVWSWTLLINGAFELVRVEFIHLTAWSIFFWAFLVGTSK